MMFASKRRVINVLFCVTAIICVLCTPSFAAANTRTSIQASITSATSGLSTLGLQGWKVQSSASITQSGNQISLPGFSTAGFLNVTPDDAGAPGTEIEALLQNGICPHDPTFPINQNAQIDAHNIFFSDNMQKCFGFEDQIGQDTVPEFSVPWWFRTDFQPNLRPGQDAKLIINGIVGQADLWVNGTEVATQATLEGDFTRHTFDITTLVQPGLNSLALELYPNNPNVMLTLDTVDWNQIAPDNNTGIQFPIQLHLSNALSIDNAHVMQNNAPDLSSSALTVNADVTNNTAKSQTGTVSATITAPGGTGETINVSQQVTLPAYTTQTVTFDPSAYPDLNLEHPQIWWPYQMGGQPLYSLSTAVSQNGALSDSTPGATFGIRTNTSYLTAPSSLAPSGVRVHAINGRPFVLRAGGFAENLFLHYSSRDLASQIALIKSLGLNAIRTEGKQMPADFYEQMDRAGIMIDAGFQCCDSWQPDSSGRDVTAQDYQTMYLSSFSIGAQLRNHPSVIDFAWSDNNPIQEQEVVSLQGFAQAGFQEPMLSSAEYNDSAILGPAGQKEGPYDWVPPTYWYDTTHGSNNAVDNDPTLTNVGGSWGLDSEQSAGDTVPTLDSIQRFMSQADQNTLWQQPDAHQYHLNYESSNGEHVGYSFGTLDNFDQALSSRYGQWSSLAQYVQQAQVQNYEITRAQFEAFIDHSTNPATPATGTDYWQLNKGWPTLLWSLYNSDYDQAGSFFGTQKANQGLHVLYAYDNGTVTIDNLTGVKQANISVEARVRDLSGKVLDNQTVNNLSLLSQGVHNAVITPRTPAATVPPAKPQTYWVELVLKQNGKVIDRNVYWLSTQQDVVDWTDTQGNPQALTSATTAGQPQYTDLRDLQGLAQAQIAAVASTSSQGGKNVTHVTLTNTSTTSAVSFFLRADVRRGSTSGHPLAGDNQILPITWSDNDITLWPGQSQTLTATYDASLLQGATPVVSIYGWNLPQMVVPAPTTAQAIAAVQAAASQAGIENFGTVDGTAFVTNAQVSDQSGFNPQSATSIQQNGKLTWKLTSSANSPTTFPHSSFTQGDTADTYTVTVTNVGSIATDGTSAVTLTNIVDPGLSLVSLTGTGWTCDTTNNPTLTCSETGGPGGKPAVLSPGQSYPPLTLTVQVAATAGYGRQDATAGLNVTNAVSVVGGAPAKPMTAIVPQNRIVGPANLTVDNAIASAFRQGDTADAYQITVINQGAGDTSGSPTHPIVATVSLPSEETAVALYGSGWTCHLAAITTPFVEPAHTCYRSDILRGENGEAPPITLLVKVSPTAPGTITQKVTVSGGGETISPATVDVPTTILSAPGGSTPPPGQLTVTSAQTGDFNQGDNTDTYTLTVHNASSSSSTQGKVTVTDTLPPGLTATEMKGDGWTCSLQAVTLPRVPNTFEPSDTCSRSDSLVAGVAFPPITLTVAVASTTQPLVSNAVTVEGGSATPTSMTSLDATTIKQKANLRVTAFSVAGGAPYAPFAQGDGSTQHDLYTIDVANVGFAPTNGPATLTARLPNGLTAISMAGGSSWSCTASTATCVTRSGVTLAAGVQSVITLEVAVSANAPRSVLTRVQVTGGGEIDPSNNFYTVPTSIRNTP